MISACGKPQLHETAVPACGGPQSDGSGDRIGITVAIGAKRCCKWAKMRPRLFAGLAGRHNKGMLASAHRFHPRFVGGRRRLAVWLAVCGVWYWTSAGFAAAADSTPWLTGPALEKALNATAGVTWSGMPLRNGLRSLSAANHVAVVLDRRVDPEQELELAVRDQSLRACFEQIAADRRLAVGWLGPVAYFGPRETVERLRTVAALRRRDVAALPATARKAWVRARAWKWADLATPRELLQQLQDEGQFDLDGLDGIPHDLWAGADLPPLSLVDRLSLVLAAYHATFTFSDDGREVAMTPIPDDVSLERTYPGGADPDRLAEEWRALLPDCRIEVAGRKVVVRGRVEDLEQIESARAGNTVRTKVAGPVTKHYTLTVKEQPLSAVLPQLVEALALQLKIDEPALERAGIDLDRRISFEVKEATIDALLTAALEPAGLSFRRSDDSVEVFPRP
jgi:hypothetical protein